jgi:hypothetical protein
MHIDSGAMTQGQGDAILAVLEAWPGGRVHLSASGYHSGVSYSGSISISSNEIIAEAVASPIATDAVQEVAATGTVPEDTPADPVLAAETAKEEGLVDQGGESDGGGATAEFNPPADLTPLPDAVPAVEAEPVIGTSDVTLTPPAVE